MSDRLRVAVLMGGHTAEREISMVTGQAVASALRASGHEVQEIVLGDLLEFVAALRECDVVFPALHGGDGEDGHVQAVLDLARIAYVGSAPGPSAVAMDKVWTKAIARDIQVPTVGECVFEQDAATSVVVAAGEGLDWPVVLKPVSEGSAVGVTIAEDGDTLARAWNDGAHTAARWMLEPYVAGREITVPVLWGEATPVIEIRPKDGFYDYANKYTAGRTEYDCPADLPPELAEAVASDAVRLYRALGLRDMARIDFRLDADNRHFLLEVNTIPGMTGTSLLPMGAAAKGISFVELCDRFCRVAHQRGSEST